MFFPVPGKPKPNSSIQKLQRLNVSSSLLFLLFFVIVSAHSSPPSPSVEGLDITCSLSPKCTITIPPPTNSWVTIADWQTVPMLTQAGEIPCLWRNYGRGGGCGKQSVLVVQQGVVLAQFSLKDVRSLPCAHYCVVQVFSDCSYIIATSQCYLHTWAVPRATQLSLVSSQSTTGWLHLKASKMWLLRLKGALLILSCSFFYCPPVCSILSSLSWCFSLCNVVTCSDFRPQLCHLIC